MAYFDSPKNYAFWQKELEELKKQRAAKANGGDTWRAEVSDDTMLFRESVTLDELIEEETGKKPTIKLNTPEKSHSTERTMKVEL